MVWVGVTSAVGSDARKRDDDDAWASPRSDDAVFERALDAPKGGGEWFSAKGDRDAIGLR